MNYKIVYLGFFAVWIVISSINLRAQETTIDEMLFGMDAVVVTASKVEEKPGDAPATVIVITAQEIKQRGYQDLKDILLDLPGFDITPNIGGENGGWQVLQRGIYGNNKIQVLLNGIRLNPGSGDRFVWGNNIPLGNIKRVEVIYGPTSALYGADAFAGIINIITKDEEEINGHELNLLYGTNNTRGGSYLFGKKFKNGTGLQLYTRMFYSDGFDFKKEFPELYGPLDTRFQTVDDPELRKFEAPVKDYNLFAKLNHENFSVLVSRSHFHENNTRGENVKNYVMNKDAFWAFDKDIIAFMYRLDLSDKVNLISNLRYDRYVVDPKSNYKFWWGNAHKYAEAKRTNIEEQLNIQFTEKINCTVGIDIAEIANVPYSFDLTTPLDNDAEMWIPNPVYGYIVNGETITFKGCGPVNVRTFGTYGQLKYSPIGNLHLTLGGRYDYNSHYKHEVFNPRAGAVYHPSEKVSIKFLYGSAFISPSMWSNYIFWISPTFGHVEPSVLGLKLNPEKLTNVEGNLTYKFSSNLISTIALYQHYSKDIICNRYYGELNILDTQEGPAKKRGVETSVNSGEQKVTGVDLITNYQFLPNWYINANYSYISGTIEEKGTKIDLPKVSRHKGVIGISGEFMGHFGLYIRERWVGEIKTLPSNNYVGSDYGGDNTLDGYSITNVHLRAFNFVDGLEFFIKIDNLFDKKCYGVGMDIENDVYGNVFPRLPLDPRTILVGATYKF